MVPELFTQETAFRQPGSSRPARRQANRAVAPAIGDEHFVTPHRRRRQFEVGWSDDFPRDTLLTRRRLRTKRGETAMGELAWPDNGPRQLDVCSGTPEERGLFPEQPGHAGLCFEKQIHTHRHRFPPCNIFLAHQLDDRVGEAIPADLLLRKVFGIGPLWCWDSSSPCSMVVRDNNDYAGTYRPARKHPMKKNPSPANPGYEA